MEEIISLFETFLLLMCLIYFKYELITRLIIKNINIIYLITLINSINLYYLKINKILRNVFLLDILKRCILIEAYLYIKISK